MPLRGRSRIIRETLSTLSGQVHTVHLEAVVFLEIPDGLVRIGIGVTVGTVRSEVEIAGLAQQGLHLGDVGPGVVAAGGSHCALKFERFRAEQIAQAGALLPRLLERGKARVGIIVHQGSGFDAPFAGGAGAGHQLALGVFVEQPYEPPARESRALSIAKAAGLMGLRDASLPKGATMPQPGSSVPGAALTGVGNALSAPPGFTSLSAGTMGVASAFLSGPSPEGASAYSHLLAWMPRTEAADLVAARDKIDALVQKALAEVLEETPLPDGVTVERREWDTIFTEPVPPLPIRIPDRWSHRMTTFRLNGGECSQPKVTCHYQISVGIPPIPEFAPTFIGGYPAWAFDRLYGLPHISRTFVDNRNWLERWDARFPDLDVYRNLSVRLPEWVYLYLAPQQVSYLNGDTGKLALLPYPMVLNRGELLFFVHAEQ